MNTALETLELTEMNKTTFHIAHMDCQSEEQMIRIRLDGIKGVEHLEFDLNSRHLNVFHRGSPDEILSCLKSLKLGAQQIEHQEGVEASQRDESSNRGPLMWALGINLALFCGEMIVGLIAGSMGLVADSLDMLADALVYALSLAAVGGTLARKQTLAATSGYLQISLALFGLVEVVRRFIWPSDTPEVGLMVGMSLIALTANVATLLVLRRTTRGEAHIEASWIFTSNDIKINMLVILAAGLVWWSSSQWPDLIVGGLIFIIVARGARSILSLARKDGTESTFF